MPRTNSARVVLIGEAKCTNRQRDLSDLNRLEHIRELLGTRAQGAALALFSRVGFRDELLAAGSRDDIALVTLADMYAR
jgi:hypothetical protein